MELPFSPMKVTIGGEEFVCNTQEEYLRLMHQKVTKPIMEHLAQAIGAVEKKEI